VPDDLGVALTAICRCCEEWLAEFPMPTDASGLPLADLTHQHFLAIREHAARALIARARLTDAVDALDELLAALADARRRYAVGDTRALESTMLAAAERQALRARAQAREPVR
jgi:hypothetical protein